MKKITHGSIVLSCVGILTGLSACVEQTSFNNGGSPQAAPQGSIDSSSSGGISINALTKTTTNENLMGKMIPASASNSDGAGVDYELGTHFQSGVPGQIIAIRFYKSPSETGTHIGHLWTASGQLLATVTFTSETTSGWQKQALASPVSIAANTEYVVTVNTGNTYYVSTVNGLATSIVSGDLSSVVGNNGSFGPVGQFPTQSWNSSNYFRDIVFAPGVSASPTPSPSASPTVSPTPSPSPTTSPKPSPSPSPTSTSTPPPSPSPSPTGTGGGGGTAFYIRAGATGNNTGSDWANACPDFSNYCDPGKMVRGATYFVAGGTYSASINFNTPASGTTPITIKGATVANHGSNLGWSPSYSVSVADGGQQAVFADTPTFTTNYWVFDGSVGTGQSSHTSSGNFGFARHDATYFQPSTGTGSTVLGGIIAQGIVGLTISHYEVDGVNWDVPKDDGYNYAFWTPTVTDSKGNPNDCLDMTNGLTLDHVYLHDIKGSALVMGGNLKIQYSSIVRIRSTPNWHGEGVASRANCDSTLADNSIFHHNYWVDVNGTGSIVALYNKGQNWQVYSNVFYATGATCTNCNGMGPTVVDNTSQGWIIGLKFYNNTVYNTDGKCGVYSTNTSGSSGFDVQNNIFYGCGGGMSLSANTLNDNLYWKTYVYFCDGTNGCPGKADIYLCGGVTNCYAPFTTVAPSATTTFANPSAYDLHVNGNTIGGYNIQGVNLGAPYNVDMDGKTRVNWTRGAFEF